MSPRVAYWTEAFETDMEAVAGEVRLLRDHFPRSVAWGVNSNYWLRFSKRKGWIFHPRLHLLFRAATRCLEPAFSINHIFGSIGDWYHLRSVRTRPTIVTCAVHREPGESRPLLSKVNRFVVEYPGGKEVLEREGIDSDRIHLILPPVDLRRFAPSSAPTGPFTVLFASSPDQENWLEARGVPLILEAAARRPEMRFRLLWRPWGNSLGRVEQWIAERKLHNVTIEVGKCRDMARQYEGAHVVIAPFTDASRAKPSPNSIIEGLACGRPALVTSTVGLADLVAEYRGGLVCPPSSDAIVERLDRLEDDWARYSRAARNMAEALFDNHRFVESYRRLYEDVLAECDSPARRRETLPVAN